MILTENLPDANECIRIWKDAVTTGKRFCEFPTASGYLNCHLTAQIVRVCVVNQDLLDEMAVEGLKRRKRIEAESDYSGG